MASLKDTVRGIAKEKEMKLPDHVIGDLNQIDRDIDKQKKAEEKNMTAEGVLKDLQREKHFSDFDEADWDKVGRYLKGILRQ